METTRARLRRVQTDLGEVLVEVPAAGEDQAEGQAVLPNGLVEIAPWPRARYPDAIPTLTLNTTTRCNLRCRYCFAHPSEADYELPTMPMEVARRAVDFLCDTLAADSPLAMVQSTLLGEPEMDLALIDGIGEYVARKAAATGKRIEWHFAQTTNLVTLPPEEFLCRLPWVTVSLDGPPEVHDAMRCFADGRGSYHLTVANLRTLQRHAATPVGLWIGAGATLTALEPEVTRIFLHLYDFGFDAIAIKPVRLPPGQPGAIDLQSVESVKEGYTRFVDFLLAQEPDQLLAYLKPIRGLDDFFGRHLMRALRPGRLPYRCAAGKWNLSVDYRGDLYPCFSFAPMQAYRMGSVFEGLAPAAQRFWAEDLFIENRAGCRGCSARDMCGGGCYHQALLATGRPERPAPAMCRLTRHLTKLGRRMAHTLMTEHPEVVEVLCERPMEGPAPVPEATCAKVARGAHEFGAWESAHPVVLADRQLVKWKLWRGPADLSAEVHLGWDEQHLHVRVSVRDDVFAPPAPETRFARGDSVLLDLYPLPSPSMHYGVWLGCVAGKADLVTYERALPVGRRPTLRNIAARAAVERHGDRTDYQLSLPWSEMEGLAPGRDFGIAVSVGDDNGRMKGWMRWPAGTGYATVHCTGGRGRGPVAGRVRPRR